MKKTIISILAVLFLVLLIFKFYQKEKYVNYLTEQSNIVKELYDDFTLDYYSELSKNKLEFNVFLDWVKKNNCKSLNIFKRYDFSIKYDSIAKKTIVYSYGSDKEDNSLINTVFNKLDVNRNQYLINDINLFDFIFKINKHDVIIIELADVKFPCKELVSLDTTEDDRLNLFQLNKDMISVFDDVDKRKTFFDLLYKFEKSYNDEVKNHNELLILFFLYEKGELKVICKNKLSLKKVEKIRDKLEKYFSLQENEYFDQAFFALRLLNDDEKPRSS